MMVNLATFRCSTHHPTASTTTSTSQNRINRGCVKRGFILVPYRNPLKRPSPPEYLPPRSRLRLVFIAAPIPNPDNTGQGDADAEDERERSPIAGSGSVNFWELSIGFLSSDCGIQTKQSAIPKTIVWKVWMVCRKSLGLVIAGPNHAITFKYFKAAISSNPCEQFLVQGRGILTTSFLN